MMEDPQISPFTIISESDLKKMDDENESTVHNIQQLIRNRLGRQREQIMNKKGALHMMHELASKLPVELSAPREVRADLSPGTPESLASVRKDQAHKAAPEKKQSTNLDLTIDMIKKGLLCHGYHPFLLRHSFLRLEIPSLDLKNIDVVSGYEHLMYLNVADNVIDDLSILSKFPSLLQLNARYSRNTS
jgi:hypothetical protein